MARPAQTTLVGASAEASFGRVGASLADASLGGGWASLRDASLLMSGPSLLEASPGGHWFTPQIQLPAVQEQELHPLVGGGPMHPASDEAASGPWAHATSVHATWLVWVQMQSLQPSVLAKSSPGRSPSSRRGSTPGC